MAADVSSLVRILNRCYYNSKDDQMITNDSGKSTGPITRDFLGESFCSKLDDSQELDLDLQVPDGWEKRLDLKSGKVYIQKCGSSTSYPSSSYQKHQANSYTKQTAVCFQDLNFPPQPKSPLVDQIEETSFDLKLVPSSSLSPSSPTSCSNQSVCTLDKVKTALERAKKELASRKRSSPSNSSSSIRVTQELEEENEDDENISTSENGLLFAAGCPNCLLYVMISKSNPKCPRCNSYVPLPVVKKPRIDLNMSI